MSLINIAPYVVLLSIVDVLRFIAVFAIALLSWVAYKRTSRAVFAFTAVGFTAFLIGIILRYMAVIMANRNALCLGCIGFEAFFAYFYLSIMAMVLGAWFIAFAYIKRFHWVWIVLSVLLALGAVRIALISFPAFTAMLAFIFGFIAIRTFIAACRSKRAFATAFAFFLIAVSFALESLWRHAAWLFPLGEVLGLVGFVILAAVLVRVWLR